MGGLGIQDGYLCIPYNGEFIGIPLWFVGVVFAVFVGFVVIVALAAMSSKRREKP